MVKIQPKFMSDDACVSTIISDDEKDEKTIKNLAIEIGFLKKWSIDCYECGKKQTHHRYAFRTLEKRKEFEESIRKSKIFETENVQNGPKIFRHKAK